MPRRIVHVAIAIAIATAIALTITAFGWSHAQATSFEATAIVGPVSLRVNPVRVARIVTTLNRGPHPQRDDDIEFSIRPVRFSRLTLVTARGDDPSQVTAAANERAIELVERLNYMGRGLGVFALSSPAVQPPARQQPPRARPFVIMGLIAIACLTAATLPVKSSAPARTSLKSRSPA